MSNAEFERQASDTPTADAVERYLSTEPKRRDSLFAPGLSQGTPDPIPVSESIARARYTLPYSHHYYGRAYDDPFAYQTIFFQVAERLGYRLSYVETRPDAGGDHRWTPALA